MPWEIDGRSWHTSGRVDRRGNACRWDGRILERVVDRIHDRGEFSDTDWNNRSVVEIAAQRKSDGWFFHAITGETWLLKMKFRVYRGTFRREDLEARIALKTLNELDELPIYGNEPRVKVRAARGPWQEVELRVHALAEIDTPEFWSFLDEAVSGFFAFTDRAAQNLEDHTPWKKLGQRWHLLRKGFPPGQRVRWDVEVLEELHALLGEVAPQHQFLWNNQQLVRMFVRGCPAPWATLLTKRPEALTLALQGPKGAIPLGRIVQLGCDRSLDETKSEYDLVKLRFRTVDDLHRGDLAGFLTEHLNCLRASLAPAP
jgi:excinuclease ABC subunit A